MSARSPAWRRGSSVSRRSCARTRGTPRARRRPIRRGRLLGPGGLRARVSRVGSRVTRARLASSWPSPSLMRSSTIGPSAARAAEAVSVAPSESPSARPSATKSRSCRRSRSGSPSTAPTRCAARAVASAPGRGCPVRSGALPSGPGCKRRSPCCRCVTGSRAAMPQSSAGSSLAAPSRAARSTRSATRVLARRGVRVANLRRLARPEDLAGRGDSRHSSRARPAANSSACPRTPAVGKA
jgi:hypothetical protein